MTTAYPLTWPDHIPRQKYREKGKFKTTLSTALENVQRSLRLFARDSGKAIPSVIISSNYSLGVERPTDPGVSVWFTWDGLQVCIPIDRYQTIASNLQAIHHVIEARRVELRHGTLALVRATFTGFKALPPASGSQHWTTVLDLPPGASRDEIDRAYREKAKTAHPDTGGSSTAMTALTAARDAAIREKSAN